MKKWKAGFVLGRFQPFHREHAKLLKTLKKECEEVYVGVLNTEFSAANPFTYGEREEMILGYDDSLNVFPYKRRDIIGLGLGLRTKVPFPATYYSGDRAECLAYLSIGFPVRHRKRARASATEVRERLYGKGGWEKLVPESTAKVVRRVWKKRKEKLEKEGKEYRVSEKYGI